ncbi:MAG TPA: phosphoenolpyruvate carboxykinase (ATP) [Candidatus Acidoferrales bacterium]|nr:phosphoenolpyruvate carboxykinase (ATP) [Candidatus Acidoferrales bacterium]
MATMIRVSDVAELLSEGRTHFNLSPAALVEHTVRRHEANLAANGAIVGYTNRTGRSPGDKFIVKDETSAHTVAWGAVNAPFEPDRFDALYERVMEHLRGRELYVQDLFCGADPLYRLPVRFVNEYAWHNLFVRQLFLRPTAEELKTHRPEFTVISAPEFKADPRRDGVNSEVFILLNFTRRTVLIGGTSYAGEMKKSIFSVMNFLLPSRNVFPMHCSANVGRDGVSALFFGLSGTGKTTLSADPSRDLVGDDEHGWSADGVFNFEGGCYAKCIKLSKKNEPQIWNALRFGCVLENVTLDPDSRVPDYNDDSKTENTRAAYPVDFIHNAVIPGVAGHPRNIVFLTADAFGVLPPISRLTPEQAMYHFLSGYTAKIAGTEAGVKEPTATFSTCFGSPFLPLRPKVYAEMLGRRLREHNAQCWLVNTGWQGGPYGVGSRMEIPYTRAMVDAAVEGELSKEEFEIESAFGFAIPKFCHGVPPQILNPRNAWPDKAAYDNAAGDLCSRFAKNFEHFDVPPEIRSAGPRALR